MAYPISIDTDILMYQERLLIYIYKNLHAAIVFGLKGRLISISYSLNLKRYPFVLKSVKKNESNAMMREHITGIDFVRPTYPKPMQVAIPYPTMIRYRKNNPINAPIVLFLFFLS